MRIVFFCNWYVKQTIPIANALADQHDVALIVPLVRGDASSDDGRIGIDRLRSRVSAKVSLIPLKGMQGFSPMAPIALWQAWRFIRGFAPDVVHLHESYDFRSLLLRHALPRVPFVLTVHDPVPHPGEDIALRRFKYWVRDRTRHSASSLIVLSDGLRQVLANQLRLPLDRVAAVHLGASFHGAVSPTAGRTRDTRRRILFFGRWEAYKGLDVLIRAESAITAHEPRAVIVLAGAGRVRLSDLTPLMSHPERFEVLNYAIPDERVPALFASAEMLVLPYRQASQSGPLQIAAHYGLPVVASDVGAVADSIEHGITGLLVPPGDPDALATAICRLLDDPVAARRMGDRAMEIAQESRSDERIAEQHLHIYRSVTAASTPRHDAS